MTHRRSGEWADVAERSLIYKTSPWFLGVMLVTACASCTRPETPAHSTENVVPHTVHWGYEIDNGPASWGTLNAEFAFCDRGTAQSPIDLGVAVPGDAARPELSYQPASLRIAHQEHVVDVLDNGHTIQVTYDEGSTLSLQDKSYELRQYHFHAPSEHSVKGRQFPMEMHLVHQADDGELAVLGVLIEEGEPNNAFDPLWDNLPIHPGESRHHEHIMVDIDQLLPDRGEYYRYEGSLTTPPCSEGVHWFVMAQPLELSTKQIDTFRAIFNGNNRPVQPVNDRPVVILSGT